MKPQTICLFIALSLSTASAITDPKWSHMAFMLKPSGGELRLPINVPLVSIDDTAYEGLMHEALTPAAKSSEEPSSLETSTTDGPATTTDDTKSTTSAESSPATPTAIKLKG